MCFYLVYIFIAGTSTFITIRKRWARTRRKEKATLDTKEGQRTRNTTEEENKCLAVKDVFTESAPRPIQSTSRDVILFTSRTSILGFNSIDGEGFKLFPFSNGVPRDTIGKRNTPSAFPHIVPVCFVCPRLETPLPGGSLQTSLLCIVGELAGVGSVAVDFGVSDS